MDKLWITEFGAREGTNCTASIQKALDASTAAGGKTVLIPKGTYVTGAINLGKSSLEIQKGAVLKGSPHLSDYPSFGYTHAEMGETTSMIYAVDSENIRIYGEGTIDFNGDSFFTKGDYAIPDARTELTQEQLLGDTQSQSKGLLIHADGQYNFLPGDNTSVECAYKNGT